MGYDLNKAPMPQEATLAQRVESLSKRNSKLQREIADLRAKVAKLEDENRRLGGASTMMACAVCARGVRPRYAVSSMCAECASTKLAAETKRADDAEAQRDKLADLLRDLKLDREDHDGDCATGTWCVAAEDALDAALAEMEGSDTDCGTETES